jgi:Family of unknown function (DUF6788)
MRIPAHPTLIRRQLNSRLKQLTSTSPVLAANLAEVYRHCGKPSCHCLQGGPKHKAFQVTFPVQGKTQAVYVPKDLVTDVRSWIEEHRRLKRLLREINQLTLALIRGHVQQRRRQQGRP